jgi:hypothetical protein
MFEAIAQLPHSGGMDLGAIDVWYAQACADSVDYLDGNAFGNVTLEYYRKLCFCLDANLARLQQFLPAPLKDRLQCEQGVWLSLRRSRFATLNLLYGLFGDGSVPFDRDGLLQAQCNFVRQRMVDLQQFYKHFNNTRRLRPRLMIVN